MGSSTTKSTTTSGPTNPALNDTLTKLSKGIAAEYSPGKSLYVAPGANTTAGWNASLAAAQNPAYASGLSGAIGSYANRAAGNELGMNDPGYATLRSKLGNDVMQTVNSSYNNAGLFGSDSNMKAAASGLTDSLGALDYQQYQNSLNRQTEAATLLPQLFSGAQLPSSIQQSIGASQDANAAAQAAGPTDYLAKLSSILAGTAGASGTTTTQTQPTPPLWQQILGVGLSALK